MKIPNNPKLTRLVQLLNDGQYHDGTELGEALTITRSAVWKMIKKLQGYGVDIESVKGKGYLLREPLALLDGSRISADALTGMTARCEITAVFESIDSTNQFLKACRHKNSIHFCLAEQQTHGRGRLARAWHSPFGKNIYLSCLYPIQKDISELGGLSLVVSLAIVNTLKELMPADLLGVKWPNDVLYDGKKLSGTLIELQAESHGECQAIIGIGINVNMLETDGELSEVWTSIRKVTNHNTDRNLVCVSLMKNLVTYLNRFNEKGFEAFVEEWKRVDCLYEKQITLTNVMHQVKGLAVGINTRGHLLVKTNDVVKAFSSGDASQVRPI